MTVASLTKVVAIEMERNEYGQEKEGEIGRPGSWIGCEEEKVKDGIQVSVLSALLDGGGAHGGMMGSLLNVRGL